MQEERNILVKHVFPQLRKICGERAVSWSEVDLRWGITDEQKAEGKVLPLCLEEIRRCRPYFIGLLGQRYGHVPESMPVELLELQPWLEQYQHHSVTEIEIAYAFLREESPRGHAYMYFRDPKHLDTLPPATRLRFAPENADAAASLQRLKRTIRNAHTRNSCELRENYSDPWQLGQWVLEDFTTLIDRLYPADSVPDPLDQEATRHEAYARSVRHGFVGRERLLHCLDEHAASQRMPVLLAGEPGCGKSALLAQWVADWRINNPQDLIVEHYMGSTPAAADWKETVRRVVAELKRAFGISLDLPIDVHELRTALGRWMLETKGSRRVVLVLDSLDQLANEEGARLLTWLPGAFPSNFCVLVSASADEIVESLRQRGYHILDVPGFTSGDIPAAVTAFFEPLGRRQLPRATLTKLAQSSAALSPLYLRVVLDSLRQFGDNARLDSEADAYLAAPDLPSLYDRVVARWDEDFGRHPEHPDLVRTSLCLLACARFGLTESELLDLVGSDAAGETKPMPRRVWTPFYLTAENSLVVRAGLLGFGHEHLRAAVRRRWLSDPADLRPWRLRMANYFARQPAGYRKALELPWQLRVLDDRDGLRHHLLDIPLCLRVQERDPTELMGYWIWLGHERTMGAAYLQAFDRWFAEGEQRIDRVWAASELGRFLSHAALHSEAEALQRRALADSEKHIGSADPALATLLNNLAVTLREKNELKEAEALHRRALTVTEEAFGQLHPGVVPSVCNLAQVLKLTNRPSEAEPLMWRALAIIEQHYGPDDPEVATHLSNLAVLLKTNNRLAEAERLFRRALAINERSRGTEHPHVALLMNNLAQVLKAMGRLRDAEPLMWRALAVDERMLGIEHPHVARDLNNLAMLLHATGRTTEAEPLMRRALAIDEQNVGPDHPTLARDLENLAILLITRQTVEAETLFRRGLAIDERTFGRDHPNVAIGLSNLAQLLRKDRVPEAEHCAERAVEILATLACRSGDSHLHFNNVLSVYGSILMQNGCSHEDASHRIIALLARIKDKYTGRGTTRADRISNAD